MKKKRKLIIIIYLFFRYLGRYLLLNIIGINHYKKFVKKNRIKIIVFIS